MNLKYYNDFLFESFLLTSDYLANIIKSIEDPVAQKFVQLINKDIKTKYNLIDLTDTNDKLAFMPDSQVTTKIKSGSDPIDLFKNLPNSTTIGRIVRGILRDNDIEFTEKEIEKFVNKFKSAYDSWKIKSEKREPIKVVRGEDIRYWYLDSNYCEQTLKGKGTLGKSCMRHSRCQSYFDIYVNNPEEVGLVIYVDDKNKLKARALLWKSQQGLVLDRIYYTDDSDDDLLANWVKSNFQINFRQPPFEKNVKLTGVANSDGTYLEYPYMDQFMYYHTATKTLYNYEPSMDDKGYKGSILLLQDTQGGSESVDFVWCEIHNESYPSNDVVWSAYYSSYMLINSSVFSNWLNSYILQDDACYSEWMDDWMVTDDSIKVYLDEKNNQSDWYPAEHDDIFLDEVSGKYYIKELLVKDDDGNLTLERNIITIYEVEENSIEKYKKLYNISQNWQYYYTTEIDQKLFDIKLKSNSKKLYNKEFFKTYWSMAIFDKVLEQISAVDFRFKSQKEAELSVAHDILSKSDLIFDSRNKMYKISERQLMSLWANQVNQYFNDVYRNTRNVINYHSNRKIIHNLFILEIEDFENKLKEFCKLIMGDPREYFLAFKQKTKSKNSEKALFIEKIIEFFNFNESDNLNLKRKELYLHIEYIIGFIYESITSLRPSYHSIDWVKVFDCYLHNQDDFSDLKQ